MTTTKHGAAKRKQHTPTYNSWSQMRKRCLCKTAEQYPRYGGRGIKICEQWASFEAFAADMGERPAGMTLDRIDNDGDYSPDNCRWVPTVMQVRNRSNTVIVEAFGQKLPLAEWAQKLGLSYDTLLLRKRRGLSPEAILSLAYNIKPKGDARKPRADGIRVSVDGQLVSVQQWADSQGVSYVTAYKRAKARGLLIKPGQ